MSRMSDEKTVPPRDPPDADDATFDAPDAPKETATPAEQTSNTNTGEPLSSGGGNDHRDAPEQDGPEEDEGAQRYSVFGPKTKVFVVLMTVFSTLFSPFSSFLYLPAITPIAAAYHRSLSDINLTVTLYQVMQAIAPMFFGDLSDQVGRRPVYLLAFTIYIGANIGLALQNNYAALLVLRAMQSTGSSATVAIGSAVMADVTTAAERGGYITAVQATVMFAPALAPVLGGILTQFLGWRSTFWFLVIAAGVFLVLYGPFAPEVSLKRLKPTNKGKILDWTDARSDIDSPPHRWQWIYSSAEAPRLIDIQTSNAGQAQGSGVTRQIAAGAEEATEEDPDSEPLGCNPHHIRERHRTSLAAHVPLRHGQLCHAGAAPGRRPHTVRL